MDLNYHHLRYFREVAREGHLGRAAARLNVSQSALSIQIKHLEDRLGHPFFDRVGRRLVLTEAGRIALDHADRIFGTADDDPANTPRFRIDLGAGGELRVSLQRDLGAERVSFEFEISTDLAIWAAPTGAAVVSIDTSKPGLPEETWQLDTAQGSAQKFIRLRIEQH